MTGKDWVDILKLVGITNAASLITLLVVVLFGRQLAEVLMDRAARMKQLELDKQLEAYRAKLTDIANTRQVKLTTLQTRMADAIVELSGLLAELNGRLSQLTSMLGFESDPPKTEQLRDAGLAFRDFAHYYYVHQILLDDQTCSAVDELLKKVDKALIMMSFATNDKACVDKAGDFWIPADRIVSEVIPPIRDRLRAELQRQLGVLGGGERGLAD